MCKGGTPGESTIMRFSRKPALVVLLALLLGSVGSSARAQSPPAGCDDAPAFSDFDFWVGEWDVFARANGEHVGVNSIEKVEGGCLLLERWRGDRGSTGRSLNYYNPVTSTWRQVWVSAGAYAIDIAGERVAGSMVLEGKIWNYGTQTEAAFRGTWTPLEDGSVRQFFEQQDARGEWQPWFDGRYVRRATDG